MSIWALGIALAVRAQAGGPTADASQAPAVAAPAVFAAALPGAALPLSPAAAGAAAGVWLEGFLGQARAGSAVPAGALSLRTLGEIPALPASVLSESGARSAPAAAPEGSNPVLAGPPGAEGTAGLPAMPLRDAVGARPGGVPFSPGSRELEDLWQEGRRRFDSDAERAALALAGQAAATHVGGDAGAAGAAPPRLPAQGAPPETVVRRWTRFLGEVTARPSAPAEREPASAASAGKRDAAAGGMMTGGSAASPARPPIVALTLVVAGQSLRIVSDQSDASGAATLAGRWAEGAVGAGQAGPADLAAAAALDEGRTAMAGSPSRTGEESRAASRGLEPAAAERDPQEASFLSPQASPDRLAWWWLLPLAALALHYRREFL